MTCVFVCVCVRVCVCVLLKRRPKYSSNGPNVCRGACLSVDSIFFVFLLFKCHTERHLFGTDKLHDGKKK